MSIQCSIKIVIALIVVVASVSFSQPFTREIDKIPVTVGGMLLHQPWAGGVNTPIPQFVDIDGDSDLDLFVFDNDLSVDFYRNVGTKYVPDFRLQPHQITLPAFQTWFLFVDLNGDGKMDLLTDNFSSGVSLYRNDGTNQIPDFVLQDSTMLDSSGFPVFAGFSSIPAFVDLDGDGKIDFVSGNTANGSINFYKNVGTTSSPKFKLVTQQFSNITVIGDSCYQSVIPTRTVADNLHGASAFQFADIDANGTPDFFYGDINSLGVFLMENAGTPTAPHLQCTTNRYPPESPVVTTGYNVPMLADIDGDGDFDLFVGRAFGPIVERHGFWFLENIGNRTSPLFTLRTKDYLQTLDVGEYACPVLVDMNGDGNLDMIVGSLDGSLWYFRNDGTKTSPSFVLADTMFAGISGNFLYSPAFCDIDHNGTQDLFIGRFDGHIRYYKNTGTQFTPQFVASPSPVDTILVHQNAAPVFCDMDGDGAPDLFIGKSDGRIAYYHNAGDSANFIPALVSAFFDSINVGQDAKPTFVDIDHDGDFDLFVGNADGTVYFYENTGTKNSPQFTLRTNQYAATDPMKESAPAFGDIDGDGDVDMFIGNFKGGIHFYRNNIIDRVAAAGDKPHEFTLHQNYPNPFNPSTTMSFTVGQLSFVTLKVYDVLGKEVASLLHQNIYPGEYTMRWNALGFPSGVYYYRISDGSFSSVRKMLLLK